MHAIETIADIFVALTLGGMMLLFASATGGTADLCKGIGGTYQPQAEDVCPDGHWSSLVGIPHAE